MTRSTILVNPHRFSYCERINEFVLKSKSRKISGRIQTWVEKLHCCDISAPYLLYFRIFIK